MANYGDSWLEGTRAFEAGEDKSKNPHAYMSDKFLGWNDGWDDAAIIVDPKNQNIGKIVAKEVADV